MINVKLNENGYTKEFEDGRKTSIIGSYENDKEVQEYIINGGTIEPQFTPEELLQQIEDAKPKTVTMRQARLALSQSGLLATIDTTIASSTDEAMKIEWEYATEVRRDWVSLIALCQILGITDEQLDDLFLLASGL